ncbi:hypothetical protein AAG906_034160 [Vitis piasezkii]
METPPFGMDLNVFSTSHIFLAYKKGFSSDGGYKIKPGGSFKALVAHSPSRASALWPWPYTNVGQVGKRVEALVGTEEAVLCLGGMIYINVANTRHFYCSLSSRASSIANNKMASPKSLGRVDKRCLEYAVRGEANNAIHSSPSLNQYYFSSY